MVIAPAEMLGVVVSSQDPDTTAEMLAKHPEVLAAVDGPMFGFCTGSGHEASDTDQRYRIYDCGVVEYRHLDSTAGVDIPGKYPGNGLTVSVVNGRAVASLGGAKVAGASVSIQGYPTLIFNGTVIATSAHDTDRTGRAAVGVLGDGRVFLAIRSDSMLGFANALKSMGAIHATYLDGGGSTALYAKEQGFSSGLTSRRIITWPVFRDPQGTSWSMAPMLGTVLLGLSTAFGVWWWLNRSG